MAQPVLNVQESESKGSVAINLLPCKVHHDGPVGPTHAHWQVDRPEDGMPTAYFRGRKLHGKTVSIPEGYRGVLVQRQESTAGGKAEKFEDGHPDGSDDAPEGKLQIRGEFQDMTVWGHESVADSVSDCHLRGMEEWMEVSRKIHSYTPEVNGEKQS